MDFNDTPEEAQFRKEAFDWLKDNAPLKEGPKDSWRASSEEEGLKESKFGKTNFVMVVGHAYIGQRYMVEENLHLLKE